MKEKILMTSLFAANWADVATTAYWMNHNGSEIGVVGQGMVEYHFTDAIIYRMATTIFLVGIYALTHTHNSKWTFSTDKAMKIANGITWSAVAFNMLQMAPQFQEGVARVLNHIIH